MDIEYYRKYEPIFGSWHIEKELGWDNYGTVFEIIRKEFGETYRAALKAITIPQNDNEWNNFAIANGTSDANVLAYFYGIVIDYRNALSLMSKLKGNSHIVSYENYQVFEHEDGKGWDILIQMELLTPLYEYIKRQGGKLNEDEVIKLGKDICSALETCEKNNIIHRDIKPDNIFISDLGNYKLGNFEIARIIEKTIGASTRAGAKEYMAPEVYRGEKGYDSRADIYSLGMTLYRLLNDNRMPFMPPSPQPIYSKDRDSAAHRRLVGELMPAPAHASPDIAKIILKACSYEPENRFDSANEMSMALFEGKIYDPTEQQQYVITTYCDANGYIDPSGTIEVSAGKDLTVYFYPNKGYEVSYVEIDGLATITSETSYTFSGIDRDHSINVDFNEVEIDLPPDDGYDDPYVIPWKLYLIIIMVAAFIVVGGLAVYEQLVNKDGDVTEELVPSEKEVLVKDIPNRGVEVKKTDKTNTIMIAGKTSESPDDTTEDMTDKATEEVASDEERVEEVEIDPMDAVMYATQDCNVRSGPGREYAQLIMIKEGESVAVTGKVLSKNWYQVLPNTGEIGYVSGKYLTSNQPQPVVDTVETYLISASSGSNGSISPYGYTYLYAGEEVTYYFYPQNGYSVSYVIIDGVTEYTNTTQYTFQNIYSNHTIYVAFEEDYVPNQKPSIESELNSDSEQTESVEETDEYVLIEGRYGCPALTAQESITYNGSSILDTYGNITRTYEHVGTNEYQDSDDEYNYFITLTSNTSYRFEQREIDSGAKVFGRNYSYVG